MNPRLQAVADGFLAHWAGDKHITCVAFDLDGTLATYDGWKGATEVGEPNHQIVELAKYFHANGVSVAVLTARASHPRYGWAEAQVLEKWLTEHLGFTPEITAVKSYKFKAIFDDRAVSVRKNGDELSFFPESFGLT
jgi:hypothetical protein